jgi:hypothetical protein
VAADIAVVEGHAVEEVTVEAEVHIAAAAAEAEVHIAAVEEEAPTAVGAVGLTAVEVIRTK